MNKKFYSFLMALVMIAMCPAKMWAAVTEVTVNGFKYELGANKTATLVDCISLPAVADIPGTFTYNGSTITVTTIGTEAFNYETSVRAIRLPNTVTTIETQAFDNNYALEAIVIGSGIQTIKSKAINLGNKQVHLYIASASCPANVAEDAIYNVESGLNPDLLIVKDKSSYDTTKAPWSSFPSGYGISDDFYPYQNTVSNINYNFYPYTEVMHAEVCKAGSNYYSGEMTIPATANGYPVTSISNNAFSNASNAKTNVTTVVCNTTSVPTITNYNTYAATNAFLADMSNVTLKVPSALVAAYRAADGWKSFGKIICSSHDLKKVAKKDATCSAAGNIEHYHCDYCGNYTDKNCTTSIEDVTIPIDPTAHGYATTDVNRGECIHCHHSFIRYTTIDNVLMTASASGYYEEVKNTAGVVVGYTSKELTDGAGNPVQFTDQYVESEGKCVMEFVAPLKQIDKFGIIGNVISITIPGCVTTIGQQGLMWCYAQTITLSEGLQSIGYKAFEGCDRLTTIKIPASVTDFGSGDYVGYTFYGCEALTNVTLPEGLTTIVKAMFYNCTALNTITLPSSLQSIGAHAFRQCSSLKSINLPSNLQSIGNYAFYKCENLGSITLPSNLQSIGEKAFSSSSNLAKVEFSSIPLVASDAFGVDSNSEYTLALTDDSYVYTDATNSFPAADAIYKRTNIKNQWGTLVLPFEVLADQEEYDLYSIISVDDEELTLERPEGILSAGTPVLIRMSEAGKDPDTGKYNLHLPAANETLKTSGKLTSEKVDGFTLTGNFQLKDLSETSGYIIADNAFWNIQSVKGDNKVYLLPFRAYLAGTVSAGAPDRLSIGSDDVNALEAIDALTSGEAEYFDLNGRPISDLQEGVNIVKRGGKSVKVIIK